MTAARAQILAGIRRSLQRDVLPEDRAAALDARLAAPPRGLVPARSAGLDRAGLLALFERQAQAVACSVARVAAFDAVPEALLAYLKSQNLPAAVEMSPDPTLDRVPWDRAKLLTITRGVPSGAEGVGVTAAFAAVAETGTLALLSGPDTPASMALLPETHIAVVPCLRIVRHMEDVFALLRHERGEPPRALNFISGPSRTGDIEQTIVLGAHGPYRVHLILVERM